ncbi:hypothetical protein [Staphylococcus aureus]|uniref:hypothetical protein n=1 Tax=Staphylococcus aureus TaxID=1280 RepID=UPI00301D2B9C
MSKRIPGQISTAQAREKSQQSSVSSLQSNVEEHKFEEAFKVPRKREGKKVSVQVVSDEVFNAWYSREASETS